jgi:hypothetical protein
MLSYIHAPLSPPCSIPTYLTGLIITGTSISAGNIDIQTSPIHISFGDTPTIVVDSSWTSSLRWFIRFWFVPNEVEYGTISSTKAHGTDNSNHLLSLAALN